MKLAETNYTPGRNDPAFVYELYTDLTERGHKISSVRLSRVYVTAQKGELAGKSRDFIEAMLTATDAQTLAEDTERTSEMQNRAVKNAENGYKENL